MSASALVSCLCVTKNRQGFLKKAIAHFDAQTYPNKELVIICERGADSAGTMLPSQNVKVITLPAGSTMTLGERRNLSVQQCNGDYFCQWDDDDWYHYRRLELQMNDIMLRGKPACVLNRLILYDRPGERAYLSSNRLWEGTLLCKTELVNEGLQYPKINRGEDHSLVVSLHKRGWVQTLYAPYLYSYLYHGGNTWDASHFEQLFQAGYSLNDAATKLMASIFNGEYDCAEASQKLENLDLEVLLFRS